MTGIWQFGWRPRSNPTDPGCTDVAELLPGVALRAASEEDEQIVLAHLSRCVACSAKLDNWRETTGMLAVLAPPAHPSTDLRARMLAAAQAERPAGVPLVRPLPRRRTVGHTWAVGQWTATAAAVLIAVGSLGWAASLQNQVQTIVVSAQLDHEKATRYDRIVGVLASQGLRIRDLTPSQDGVNGYARVYLDPEQQTGMVMVHDLPINADRAWQLWFVRGNERISGGILRVDGTGSGYSLVSCPPDLQGIESVGVTNEPTTGSVWPTTPGVLGARLD